MKNDPNFNIHLDIIDMIIILQKNHLLKYDSSRDLFFLRRENSTINFDLIFS